jgi:hypothetical protein
LLKAEASKAIKKKSFKPLSQQSNGNLKKQVRSVMMQMEELRKESPMSEKGTAAMAKLVIRSKNLGDEMGKREQAERGNESVRMGWVDG